MTFLEIVKDRMRVLKGTDYVPTGDLLQAIREIEKEITRRDDEVVAD